MAKDIEIEIQVQVQKVKPLLDFLRKSAKLVGQFHQVDQYFTPHHRNFIAIRPTDEWLRLRDSSGKFSINYKNWHHDKKTGKTNHCDEYETKVEDISPLRKIFTALDIKPITTVNKKRQIWLYKDFEVAIDSVKGLEDFVEIEYKGKKKADPKKITEQMIQFLKDRRVGKISRNYQGYPFLLLFPGEAKYEEQ